MIRHMGRFVSMYVVDLDQAHRAIGSGDDTLRTLIEKRCAAEFAEDASYFDGDDTLSLRDALAAVIAGGPFHDGDDYRYNTAYLSICEGLAVWNIGHGPYRGDWLSQVDAGFRELGIDAIGFTDFEHDTPDPLPYVEDCGYGEWTHHDCVRAVTQWKATTPDQRARLHPGVLEWLVLGVEAAEVAATSPGLGIAGCFSI
jgi:hypothetical protein